MLSELAACQDATHADENTTSQHFQANNTINNNDPDAHNKNENHSGFYFSGVETTNLLSACPSETLLSDHWEGVDLKSNRIKAEWYDILKFTEPHQDKSITVEEAYLFCVFRSNGEYIFEACAQAFGCHVDMKDLNECNEFRKDTINLTKTKEPGGRKLKHTVFRANDHTHEDYGEEPDICSVMFNPDSGQDSDGA